MTTFQNPIGRDRERSIVLHNLNNEIPSGDERRPSTISIVSVASLDRPSWPPSGLSLPPVPALPGSTQSRSSTPTPAPVPQFVFNPNYSLAIAPQLHSNSDAGPSQSSNGDIGPKSSTPESMTPIGDNAPDALASLPIRGASGSIPNADIAQQILASGTDKSNRDLEGLPESQQPSAGEQRPSIFGLRKDSLFGLASF